MAVEFAEQDVDKPLAVSGDPAASQAPLSVETGSQADAVEADSRGGVFLSGGAAEDADLFEILPEVSIAHTAVEIHRAILALADEHAVIDVDHMEVDIQRGIQFAESRGGRLSAGMQHQRCGGAADSRGGRPPLRAPARGEGVGR